jgi:hypothetical protein
MLCSGLVVGLDRGLVNTDSLCGDDLPNALLENEEVVLGEGVGFSNNRDEIDTRAETLHDLDVERLQSVSGGPNEVQATMDPEVGLLPTLGLLFLSHIGLVLVIDEIDDWGPRVTVVDIVAESWGVNDAELDFELLLLELGLDYLDLGKLVELLVVTPGVVFGRRQLGSEERVHESGLAKTRFTDYHHGEVCTMLGDDFVPLVREVCNANAI